MVVVEETWLRKAEGAREVVVAVETELRRLVLLIASVPQENHPDEPAVPVEPADVADVADASVELSALLRDLPVWLNLVPEVVSLSTPTFGC